LNAFDQVTAISKELLASQGFIKVDQQVLHDETIAEVSFKSDSLKIMIKLFISEMEGEGGVYLAPLGTQLGYREDPNWISELTAATRLIDNPLHNKNPLAELAAIPFPQNTPALQVRAALEWVRLNTPLIQEMLNQPSSGT
jgi:hypothetical protein